jgi:hypothetical protein
MQQQEQRGDRVTFYLEDQFSKLLATILSKIVCPRVCIEKRKH